MSPVKAPAGSVWQFWPPMATPSGDRGERHDQCRGRTDHEVDALAQIPRIADDLLQL
jgi:hypothetical protein